MDLKKATHRQVFVALEAMSDDDRDTLAFRILDLANTVDKPELCNFYAAALVSFMEGQIP